MINNHSFLKRGIIMRLIVVITGVLCTSVAMAAASVTLTGISTHVTTAVKHVSDMMEDVSLIAGVGFIMASFFKFHQHKLNPTQVPLSQGVTLMLVGAGLSIMPHLLGAATEGLFGASVAKLGSGGIGSVIST
jgi:intracellular multiplication protein IcmD